MTTPRYPLPVTPDGWYRVGASADLARGHVRPVRYFGRDLVLFRNEVGQPRLFDAFCPHLGAHLGYGGRVRGEGIQCPFHGWCFDGDGHCVAVPNLDRNPPRAGVHSYPIRERMGMMFAWFHAKGEGPNWEVADERPGGSEAWSDWTIYPHQVRTHVQDMGENIIDLPHFTNVHDMDELDDKRFGARFEGPRMIVEQTLKMSAGPSAGVEVLARTVNSGPGISVTTYGLGAIETLTLVTQTPVEEELVSLELAFCMKRLDDAALMAAVEKLNRDVVNQQFTQDIPIWEHRIYRERPMLTAVDGPVLEYRRWYKQFYSSWSEDRGE